MDKREFEVQQIGDCENPASKTIKLSNVYLKKEIYFFQVKLFYEKNLKI